MDQNKSEVPPSRQWTPPVDRQPIRPVARSFSAAPIRPAPVTNQQSSPFAAPVSQSTLQPIQQVTFAPRTFDPPAPQPKTPKAPRTSWRERLTKPTASKKIRAAAAVLGLFVVVGGVLIGTHVGQHGTTTLGVKPHGRKIAIGEPTVGDGQLETSCYTLNLPSKYQVSHIAGCGSELTIPQGAATSLISIVGTPSTSTFKLSQAPEMIRDQLKLIGSNISDYQTVKTVVNGEAALKVLYSINNGPEQVLIYVPNLPAEYLTDSQAAGAFMLRGYYANSQQQANFDNAVNSLKWVR